MYISINNSSNSNNNCNDMKMKKINYKLPSRKLIKTKEIREIEEKEKSFTDNWYKIE